MKQKCEKKLVLSKETVSNLDSNDLKKIKGGSCGNSICQCFTDGCNHN